jgi:NAD(P)-dependent dehydrogenase (short-subunit alcohol dehydrogenase family)
MVLRDRTAVVTGSGGAGCGRAIAVRLANDGAAVVVTDINETGGEETVRIIQHGGGRAAFFRADVRDEAQVRDLIAFAHETFGDVTVLVNNASGPFRRGFEMEYWAETASTEFIGALHATRYAVDAMRRSGGGAIVNISSISALWHGRRYPGAAPVYDAAKAGLLRLTTGLAELAASDGIRVNCLAPGWISTDGPRQYWESLTPVERRERGVPARLLMTTEIADAVVRLATDDSLAGRVLLWWSDDAPRLIAWADPGYRDAIDDGQLSANH